MESNLDNSEQETNERPEENEKLVEGEHVENEEKKEYV